jgi:lysyl-tRNA synthetase class II
MHYADFLKHLSITEAGDIGIDRLVMLFANAASIRYSVPTQKS